MDMIIIKKSMCVGVEVGGASVIRLAIQCCRPGAYGRLAWLPAVAFVLGNIRRKKLKCMLRRKLTVDAVEFPD